MNIDKNIDTFKAYAEARMAEEKGDVSPMLLKKRHTMRVLANARNIIEAERPPSLLPAQRCWRPFTMMWPASSNICAIKVSGMPKPAITGFWE